MAFMILLTHRFPDSPAASRRLADGTPPEPTVQVTTTQIWVMVWSAGFRHGVSSSRCNRPVADPLGPWRVARLQVRSSAVPMAAAPASLPSGWPRWSLRGARTPSTTPAGTSVALAYSAGHA
jgi:hypothetical protein